MFKLFDSLPIDRKLLLILLFSSIISLIFAGIFLVILELSEFQRNTKEDMSALAELIGNRSSAALLYDDKALATENLSVFKNFPSVQLTCLYGDKGEVFVELVNVNSNKTICPNSITNQNSEYNNKHLTVVKPIFLDGDQIGTVYIKADLTISFWRKIQSVGLLILILSVVSILTFLISKQLLLKFITVPIKTLVTTVKEIKQSSDYSIRAIKFCDDEMGVLVDSFNGLIETVDSQNQALIRAKNRYLTLYDDNPTMVFNISPKGDIHSANVTGAKQLGISVDELQKCSIFNFIHADDNPVFKSLIERCLANPLQVHNQELRNICHNGRMIWIRATSRLVENELHESSILVVCEDITEARLLNEKIAYQADHDSLTGLANRNNFDRNLIKAISLAQQDNTEHTLCYLDLDQFKIVNDTCGHVAGDELLRQVGELLKNHVRQYDFVARLGGDEFGILMFNCTISQASTACEKLRDLIKDFNFIWEDRRFNMGVSIGLSPINITSGSAVDLLKEADAACYAAKDKGRNRVHIYSPDDEQLAMRQGEMQWVEKIRQGLKQDRFILYGQHIIPLQSLETGLHFEVLLRYQDDRGNIIPPGAFLPAAERYNLAPEMDRWIIAYMLEWLATHPDFLESLTLCSINLSGLSLSDESMLTYISNLFFTWQIPPNKICFEITETAAISNLTFAASFIQQLKKIGCQFSLDDFGSGLSSFAYLKNLPVDNLKIDGLFVKDILDDPVDLAMVKSINEVAHIMGKKTIAEFVENEAILNLLKTLGIDYAQGYGIGAPVPLDQLVPLKSSSGSNEI